MKQKKRLGLGPKSRERHIAEVLQATRKIQDFLWGEHNHNWGLEEWRRMFGSRIPDSALPCWKN